MSIVSAFAIYFVMWWIVLFAVLPFGVRNAGEAGESVGDGHDAGAPFKPMLYRKFVATTIISGVLFAVLYAVLTSGFITLDDLPFLKEMPNPV
jgi:predicted secreted protein